MLRCKFNDALQKDPTLAQRHKSLMTNNEFVCSDEMIMTMPFSFVKSLPTGRWAVLPNDYKAKIKSAVVFAEKNRIKTIQHSRFNSVTKEHIFRATLVSLSRGVENKQAQIVYLNGSAIKEIISHEPWVDNLLYTTVSICSFRTVFLGEGAKQKNTSRKNNSISQSPPDQSTSDKPNLWFCSDNPMKLCTEGSLCNLLFHMGQIDDANEFKFLLTLTDKELCSKMGVVKLPKRVTSSRVTDPILKCLWILQERFKCKRTPPLNTVHFKSASAVVDNMSKVKFPLLVSICSTRSNYNHVVVVWKNQIIDFESQSTFPLTVSNLNYCCGPSSVFLGVERGYGIIPSKKLSWIVRICLTGGKTKSSLKSSSCSTQREIFCSL